MTASSMVAGYAQSLTTQVKKGLLSYCLVHLLMLLSSIWV